MAKLTNSPADRVVLALEQRKSFSLGLWFKDHREHPVDLTGAVLRLSAARLPSFSGDVPPLLIEKTAVVSSPAVGFARVDLQAADLDLDPDDIPFVVTLVTSDGYSGVVVKGELSIQPNPESLSVEDEYLSADPSTSLDVQLRQQSVHVDVEHMIFAGPGVFTEGEKAKLAGIEPGAEVNVNADWTADSGDAEILNKPMLGTAAAADVEDFVATRTFGSAADADVEDFVAARTFGSAADADVEDFVHTVSVSDTTSIDMTLTGSALAGVTLSAEVTTAFINALKLLMYPVGSIYLSIVSTNPGTLFGGTWVAWGTGRVPVAIDTGQTEFNTVEKTGGQKTTAHAFYLPGINSGNAQDVGANYENSVKTDMDGYLTANGSSATSAQAAVRALGGSVRAAGTGNTEVRHMRYTATNLQPFITCYMWKRTA